MEEEREVETHKKHKAKQSGRKFEKKQAKLKKDSDVQEEQAPPPKKISFTSFQKADRQFRRAQDLSQKRQHIPVVDRTPSLPPPVVVAIVGPPKVGKSTLLKSLLKYFCRQPITKTTGPLTIVTGKKRRLTFIECNNDIHAMIDIAKVADVVLLVVDASFGFEMETFEFLNICQVHGFPRVVGVLTHLDVIGEQKNMYKVRRHMKHRFWTEIYSGAKVFNLFGMVYDEYVRHQVFMIARYIQNLNFRPLTWRSQHPYVLVDRVEDITDPEQLRVDKKCDRNVVFYGYARGANARPDQSFHIPGVGDYCAHHTSFLPDPCPLPDEEKHRTLTDRERRIYAPMSGLGGIVFDRDAVYIDLKGSHSFTREDHSEGGALVKSIIQQQQPIDKKMQESDFNVYGGDQTISSKEIEAVQNGSVRRRRLVGKPALEDVPDNDDNGGDSDEEHGDMDYDDDGGEMFDDYEEGGALVFGGGDDDSAAEMKAARDEDASSDDDFDDEEERARNKQELLKKMADDYKARLGRTKSYQQTVYDDSDVEDDDVEREVDEKEGIGGLFHVAKEHEKNAKFRRLCDEVDCSRSYLNETTTGQDVSLEERKDATSSKMVFSQLEEETASSKKASDSSSELLDLDQLIASIKDCFMTGKWADDEDAQKLLDGHAKLMGDFIVHDDNKKDGENSDSDGEEDKKEGEGGEKKEGEDAEDDDESSEEDMKGRSIRDYNPKHELPPPKKSGDRKKRLEEKRAERKKQLKEIFNEFYDEDGKSVSHFDVVKEEMSQQAKLNRTEFEGMSDERRVQYEGFRAGLYLRVEFHNVPCEFIENLDTDYPIVLGGLQTGENRLGYCTVRLKRHRWYKRILKSNDPFVVSCGWRRFQTQPIFFSQEMSGRNRFLKYTPEHIHCHAVYWGSITPQSSGMLALQQTHVEKGFRIAVTGVVLDLDKSTEVVKKLNLIGTPFKISLKTAFIEGMFSSELEVSKFIGATLKTVSGLRGQLKKAVRSPPGAFRATFEDKMLKSDRVMLRTWCPVPVPKFYLTVTNLLEKVGHKHEWQGLKTSGQLRFERGMKAPQNPDSFYREPERRNHYVKPLKIPANIQRDLPYKERPKTNTIVQGGNALSRVAVVLEENEREQVELLDMLKTVNDAHEELKLKKQDERVRAHHAKLQKAEEIRLQRAKQLKRKICKAIQLNKPSTKKRKSKLL